MANLFSTEVFASHADCVAAMATAGLTYDGGKFSAPGVAYVYATLHADGVHYQIAIYNGPAIKAAPVRSERHVYTQSGKKRTSRELCGRVFKKFATDRKAFVAAAIALGVRPATANAMFSHYSCGRYAA